MSHPPRASATLVVVRDSAAGLEVLLLQRAERGDHSSGAWVFPGGIVDAGDRAAQGLCAGFDDAAMSQRLNLAAGGLDYAVAALRECFEECGLLIATTPTEDAASLHGWRTRLHRGEASIADLCSAFGLTLALDRIAYIGHWITPLGRAKRFDTRFFITEAPAGQSASPDGVEIVAQQWLKPADALARGDALKLLGPTRATLQRLAGFDNVAATMQWARGLAEVPMILPRLGTGPAGPRPVLPSEFAWAEIGRLDPLGTGDAHYDIQPGVAVRLSPRVIRVTADNGSVMTGPGTNTYLIGGGPANEWAVIDPGPLDERHLHNVLAAAPGPIRWIFATHTHSDHSPNTVALKAATGAMVHGRLPAYPDRQDLSFRPDVLLQGGESFAPPGNGFTLLAIHTPGHASNHLCYRLVEEQTLFTGDHVMQSSTVVINPPDGDMAAYLQSLRALLASEPLAWLAPGHGFLMAEPARAFEHIIAHRLRREAKVVATMQAIGAASAEALLPSVYDDVPPKLHGIAMRSLLAHLGKLHNDGTAREVQGLWSLNTA